MRIQSPVVAGLFYPADPGVLQADVDALLLQGPCPAETARPIALVAPHAGYRYSGEIAASAYRLLAPWANDIDLVAVLAPSHRVPLSGIATSSADAFTTPLGTIPVARKQVEALGHVDGVGTVDAAFADEHAVEVQLPFLQRSLHAFELVPLVVGECDPALVAKVIEQLAANGALIVVSSDLSHYEPYASCQRHDQATTARIEALQYDAIGPRDACGAYPLSGLLHVARDRGWYLKTLDLRNSGDTSGDRSRVVGYGAYAVYA